MSTSPNINRGTNINAMNLKAAYRTEGMKEARRVFRKLERRGADLAPLADAVGQLLVESAVHRLAVTNRAPDGKEWPTSARARARGGPTQYDRGSGGLAGSLTHAVQGGGASVDVGSNKPYAAQRQFGGVIKPKKPGGFLVFEMLNEQTGKMELVFAREVTQPSRPYLGISDDDADDIGSIALEYLNDVIEQGGRT